MKKWNFIAKNSPLEIISKLEKTIGLTNGFVLKITPVENDSIQFSMRKRIKYGEQILHRNIVIVLGRVYKTDEENKSNVTNTFSQHFLMTFTLAVTLGVGLIAAISGIIVSDSMYLPGGTIIAVLFLLLVIALKKFEKDIQEYKTLISQILEIEIG